MPKTIFRQEIEIKLRVSDISALRARLKQLRAREISPRTHESNTLYDTARQSLRKRGQLIRIRTEQPASGARRSRLPQDLAAILTYKGPPDSSARPLKSATRFKVRRGFKVKSEAEVAVSGANEIARILGGLGLQPAFRYEKFRTTFTLPGVRSLKIELDETPVGNYLELEGTPSAIDRAARLLGYDRSDYSTETYGSLYLAACRRQGRKPGNMLFPPTKNLRHRALFP
jgi:adenylate cyclase, class 2